MAVGASARKRINHYRSTGQGRFDSATGATFGVRNCSEGAGEWVTE